MSSFNFEALKPASEVFKDNPWLDFLVYGETGSGKTTWAARSPNPLIIQLEKQGTASIVDANPDALIVQCETVDQFEQVWKGVISAKKCKHNGAPALDLGGHKVQTIVIDSLTELSYMFQKHWESKMPKESHSLKRWGEIKKSAMSVLSTVSEVGIGVIVLCRARLEDDNGRAIAVPITSPKGIADDLGGYFNVVARAGRRQGKDATAHYLTFKGQDRVAGKSHGDLPKILWQTKQAGRTTYGSIMHYLYGDLAPRNTDDDRKWVDAGAPTPEDLGATVEDVEESKEKEEGAEITLDFDADF